MTALRPALVALAAISALVACATGDRPPASERLTSSSSFECPTPSKARITSPHALTGQDLLRSSAYFSLLIAHGSMDNLQHLLASARADHNAGAAKPSDIERVEKAITFRRDNNCPDVPYYTPHDSGDVVFDGIVALPTEP